MPNSKILLMAEANKLGIDGYKRMSEDELAAAIKAAKTPSAPVKGKATTNGASAPVKGKAASKTTPAKGKASTKTKAAPAKSASRKSAPAKGTAAKGTAKRQPSASRKATPAKGSSKTTPAKGTATAKRGTTRKVTSSFNHLGNRINWNRESKVGASGKRKTVLDALRKHKGDKSAAFNEVKRYALKWYPNKDKHNADRTVVWLVGRVAYDYAVATGQHEPGERAGYGTSEKPQDVRRRERRAEAAKPKRAPRKTAGARKAAPAKGKSKTAATKGKGRR
jgi:hypothetical protein